MPNDDDDGRPNYGSVPVPDPTKLTTDAVNYATSQWRRELDSVHMLIDARVKALEDRLTAIQLSDNRCRESICKQIDDLHLLLDERYQTQTKALDAAFKAQETAVQAALANAEKAVSKAEIATEKRFENIAKSLNQLSEQTAANMSRNEASVRIDSVNEKLDADTQRTVQRLNELELRVTSRLDLAEGSKKGSSATVATLIAVASVVVAIIVAVVTIIATR